jgi:transcriptional regulator with GAF, ATPase, and Fis domain
MNWEFGQESGCVCAEEHVLPNQFDGVDSRESAIGKELVADAIHYSSNRKDKNFIK